MPLCTLRATARQVLERPSMPRRTTRGAIAALGIVFGDLGTSPLYSMQECFGIHGVAPSPANVIGAVSLVVWSLILVVTIKYLAVIMRADNRGEGGILVLLALLPERFRCPKPGTISPAGLLVLAGAALLFGDGVITPAVSVLSAVEGLEVATSTWRPFVVPLTVAILVVLFAVQRHGSARLARYLGPVMLSWFIAMGALGAYHALRSPMIWANWHAGRTLLIATLHADAPSLSDYVARLEPRRLGRIDSVGVFLAPVAHGAPASLRRTVEHYRVLYRSNVVVSVATAHVPWVSDADRAEVIDLPHGFVRIVLTYGFMQSPDVPRALADALPTAGIHASQPHELIFVVGHETIRPSPAGQMRGPWESMFAILNRNARAISDYFGLPPAQVVEIGTQVDL